MLSDKDESKIEIKLDDDVTGNLFFNTIVRNNHQFRVNKVTA